MIPSTYGYNYRNNILHVISFGGIAALLFCGSGYHIIFITLTLLFHLIVGAEINYGGSNFGPEFIVTTLTATVIFFGLVSVVGIVAVYIYESNVKLHTSNESNVSMLHGMHEGVLILSNRSSISGQRITFCNQPAGNLINQITERVGKVPNLNGAVLGYDCFEFVQLEISAPKGLLINIKPRSIDQIVMA